VHSSASLNGGTFCLNQARVSVTFSVCCVDLPAHHDFIPKVFLMRGILLAHMGRDPSCTPSCDIRMAFEIFAEKKTLKNNFQILSSQGSYQKKQWN